MTTLLLELVADYTALAEAEALALTQDTQSRREGIMLLLRKGNAKQLVSRLAYTKGVYKFLFSCSEKDVLSKTKSYPWQKVIKRDFWVRVRHTNNFKEKDLSDHIWDKLKAPKADPKSENRITFLFHQGKVYCGMLLGEPDKDFTPRRPDQRPAHSPTSLHPKLARAMVNLAGPGKTIIDPFCGVGGNLLEAGLMGLKTEGWEIDKATYYKCRTNMEHFKVKGYRLHNEDCTKIKRSLPNIVTDLPYGRSSHVSAPREQLYKDFLKLLQLRLKGKAVLMFPHYSKMKSYLKEAGFTIEHETSIYVHRSLIRQLCVVSHASPSRTKYKKAGT